MTDPVQCGGCFQAFPPEQIKDCPFHFGGKEVVVTKSGVSERDSIAHRHCPDCAVKHASCGKGGAWA